MPSITATILPTGPLVQAVITHSIHRIAALVRAQQPQPPQTTITMLIDTGATCTCIDNHVISQLGLTPTGVQQVHTPSTGGTPYNCFQYDVLLAIVLQNGPPKLFSTMPVIGAALANQGIQGLIGRDVLKHGNLEYIGPNNSFTLTF